MDTFLLINTIMSFLGGLLLLAVGLGVITVAVLYVIDVTQTEHAVRRNYPVIGRFRYLFEKLGEYFRQYFFAMDREEMPFNRAQRAWVYRSAKNVDSTVAFGSTRDISKSGTVLFVNSAFPALDSDKAPTSARVIGAGCKQPYTATSFFNISGMSYGALSRPAVRALSKGAKMAGCWLNTGEGGLSPWHEEGGADIVFQIGTAKYGARDEHGQLSDERLKALAAKEHIKMFELKLSQGAKPGKGGILPGVKVTAEIAAIRGIPEGQDSISPNRHPEIEDVDGLLDMLNHIRDVTGKPVGFKTVIGSMTWIHDLIEAIKARGLDSAPDFITIDGAGGGTGAAPQSLIDYMGLPLSESLPLVVNAIHLAGLKDRVRIIASGKLLTPADVAWALCIGADFIVTARGFMFALGCIQSMQCNKNTCPTGVTTHLPHLQRGLVIEDKAERVAHYAMNIHKEIEIIAHSCGVKEPRQLRRCHARIVMPDGKSVPLDELNPYPMQGLAE